MIPQCFGPFAVFDVAGRETIPPGSASLINRAEAEFVLVLYAGASKFI